MSDAPISPEALLSARSRLPLLAAPDAPAGLAAWLAPLLFGAAASLAIILVKVSLGWPGHHILLILPALSLGLALAPRRHTGSWLGLGALAGVGIGLSVHPLPGFGALVSTALAGPVLERAALRAARTTRPAAFLSLFALAGLLINACAFLARLGGKLLATRPGDAKPLGPWLAKAALGYPLAGLLAGLACALLLFKLSPPAEPQA